MVVDGGLFVRFVPQCSLKQGRFVGNVFFLMENQ
jgi:hypothetical protein